MDAKHTSGIDQIERTVLEYLRKHRAQPLRVADLVEALAKDRYTPVELKIAALNLVSQGEAEMSPSWELLYREQKKRASAAHATG